MKEHLEIANNFNTRSNLPPGRGVSLEDPAAFPFWCLSKSGAFETQGDETDLPKLEACEPRNKDSEKSTQAFFCHFNDNECATRLSAAFGQPSGTVNGYMTPSQRTVILFPVDQLPFIVKLDGSWMMASKHLAKIDMENALAANRSLTEFRNTLASGEKPTFCLDFNCSFEPESVFTGITIKSSQSQDFWRGNLFRKMPPETSANHSLVPFHSLANRKFLSTSLGQKIFKNNSFEDWFHTELIPKIADFVANSFFIWGTHLELHGQNLDILFDSNGKIISLVLKDLSDTAPDPMLQVSLNFATKNNSTLSAQESSWKGRRVFLNQREKRHHPELVSARHSASEWYQAYLRQLLQALPPRSNVSGFSQFNLSFHKSAVNFIRIYPELTSDSKLEKVLSYFLLNEPFSWLIMQLRETIVDKMFEQHFQPTSKSQPFVASFLKTCRNLLTGGESREGEPKEFLFQDPLYTPGRFGSLSALKYRPFNTNNPPDYWACIPN